MRRDKIIPEELAIEVKDGAQITALLYRPVPDARDILFLCLPAMGVKASYYRPLANPLIAAGYSFLICDLRGQGTSNKAAPNNGFGYTTLLEWDLPDYVRAAKRAYPDKRIILLGHSLGGQLSLLYASAMPQSVTGVAIIATGSVYWKAYRFPSCLKIWLGTQMSIWLSSLIGYFPGHKIGFGGKQPKAVMQDWARQGRTGHYVPLGSHINYEAALAQYESPVFALSIEGDKFAPHSATDHLISKLKNAHINRVLFKPSSELKPKIDHFRWVKHNQEIMTELADWADQL
jgi:predicted alpha/beta hydrolase